MTISRRHFIRKTLLAAGSVCIARPGVAQTTPRIMTVTGEIPATALGQTLPHEHVLVDFIGADQVSAERYDVEEVVRTALPYLREVKKLGCQTLFECTPNYLGRDPALLKRLAQATGLQIVTNTGYYGARQGKFLPPHVATETPPQLAERWLNEWQNGIGQTRIRPGFIKIGVDAAPLADYHRKIVEAAAITHLQSGLTIAAHTGDGAAALEEIEIVQRQGAHPSAFIWVHAQNEKDLSVHLQAARLGAWVEFDGIAPDSIAQYVTFVTSMKEAGLLNQALISHDAGWYHVGEPNGGNYRSYATVFTEFLPALKKAGFTEKDIEQLLVVNPREAFTIRVRKA